MTLNRALTKSCINGETEVLLEDPQMPKQLLGNVFLIEMYLPGS